ncbi:hypothetical protein [Streptomyces coeruleorubidus]|uniref:hypothetical protein n=1 Tax=Streptomyces coeruleorubidus TaxID=116188 RepID=UPI003657E9E4
MDEKRILTFKMEIEVSENVTRLESAWGTAVMLAARKAALAEMPPESIDQITTWTGMRYRDSEPEIEGVD